VSVEFNPFSQQVNVLSPPEIISLQDDYYPIRSDKKLTLVRNWLKESNPDLSNSVLVASLAKKFYFGTLYKLVFKVGTKYIVYVVYMDCATKEMKIYDKQELDSYNSSTGSSTVTISSSSTTTTTETTTSRITKLKGFPRPSSN